MVVAGPGAARSVTALVPADYLAEQPTRLGRWFGGSLRPGQASPLDLLIIQGTRFCNLDCKYCYLPFRSRKGAFDLDLLDTLIPKLMDAGLVPQTLPLAWHAGEPLALPIAFYREAHDRIARLVGPDITVEHNFQTNATLITDDWCRFIKDYGFRTGVSLDGPADIHDARRVHRNGAGSHAEAMRGIALLQKHDIPFSVIAVLTEQSLAEPDRLLDFFFDAGVRQLGFNVEEVEGFNRTSSLSETSIERYRGFMAHLMQRVRGGFRRMEIREFALMQSLVHASLAGFPTQSSEAVPFGNVIVDVDGNVYTYSPEFVDVTGPAGESLAVGHVDTIDFTTLYRDPAFRALSEPIAQGLELCRKTCGYFDVCGGAAPVNRLSENGTFVSTETLHCRMTRQALADVIEADLLTRMQEQRGRRAVRGGMNAGAIVVPPAAPQRRLAADPITLGLPILGARMRQGWIDLNGGTMPAVQVAGRSYDPAARVPRPDWAPADPAQLAALERSPDEATPCAFLAVVPLPAEIVAMLEKVRRNVEALAGSAGGELPPILIERIATAFGGEAGKAVSLGYYRRPGRMVTTTAEPLQRDLIGLHVDSWSARAAGDRRDAGNRVCINLGTEPRALLALNAPLGRIAATMTQLVGPEVASMNPTAIGREFMARFPDFPVTRLTVFPGEAYVAPTEAVIHDGDTTMADTDFFATVLGRFPATAVARLVAPPAQPAGELVH